MGSSINCSYSYLRVPKESPNITSFARKYKQLRLAALQLSPTSFSSTYDIESKFTDETWASRLTAPEKETFICVAKERPTSSDVGVRNDDDLNGDEIPGEWVAQVTLLGPLSVSDFALPEESGQPAYRGNGSEERWQMLSLYTLPDHRGRGVAKELCREAFQYLLAERQHVGTIRVRIMVKPENQVTVSMYRKMGFVDAGRCTLAEALRANGDGDMVPADREGEKWNKRSGLIMMLSLRQ